MGVAKRYCIAALYRTVRRSLLSLIFDDRFRVLIIYMQSSAGLLYVRKSTAINPLTAGVAYIRVCIFISTLGTTF